MPIIAALTAAALAAATGPAITPGWPVLAPPGADVFPGQAGQVIASTIASGEEGQEVTAAFTARGLRRWSVNAQTTCGNCEGATSARQAPNGTLTPIGVFNAGLWGVTTTGTVTTGCAGAIGPDGDCYGLKRSTPTTIITRGTTWSYTDDQIGPFDPTTPPTVAFDNANVYVAVGNGTQTTPQVLALNRATGALVWRRAVQGGVIGPVITPDGTIVVAARQGASVTGIAPDGTVRWVSLPGGSPDSMVLDAARSRVLVGVTSLPVYGATRYRIEAVTQTGDITRLATAPKAITPLTTTPGGSVLLMAAGSPVRLVSLRANGTVAWKINQAELNARAGTPYVAANGTVFASVGTLLYRLPRAATPRLPRRSSMWVTPSRFRLITVSDTAAPRVCSAAGVCTPSTGLGAVIELRLPKGTPRNRATFELRRGSTLVARVSANVERGVNHIPLTTGYPGTITTAAHTLTGRWRVRGRVQTLSVRVGVVKG